jgi:predicted nucleotidyltransferase
LLPLRICPDSPITWVIDLIDPNSSKSLFSRAGPELRRQLAQYFRLATLTTEHKIKKSNIPKYSMKPSQALAAHRNEIREIVLAHRAMNARVFGSVALGLDTDQSDLDILVDPTEDTTLFDLGAIRYKLRSLLGVPVDVLTPGALPDSFRNTVIDQARPI